MLRSSQSLARPAFAMFIARHILIVRTEDRDMPVEIRIAAPEEAEGHWLCAYEIDWPDGPRRFHSGGADSMQALVIAMQMVSAELYTSDYHRNGQLRSPEPGFGFGLPVLPSMRHMLTPEDAITI